MHLIFRYLPKFQMDHASLISVALVGILGVTYFTTKDVLFMELNMIRRVSLLHAKLEPTSILNRLISMFLRRFRSTSPDLSTELSLAMCLSI